MQEVDIEDGMMMFIISRGDRINKTIGFNKNRWQVRSCAIANLNERAL